MKQLGILLLDDYEASNLLSALEAALPSIYVGKDITRSPLEVLNSGGWIGQIRNKLLVLCSNYHPNRSPQEYSKAAAEWKLI